MSFGHRTGRRQLPAACFPPVLAPLEPRSHTRSGPVSGGRAQAALFSQLLILQNIVIRTVPSAASRFDETTSWDESSSISSGLSDASDNLSSEEFNASSSLNSLPSTPTASRRNSAVVLRTDSEKRSLAESGLSWFSESEEKAPRRLDYDSGSLKMEPGASKWRRERPESCDDASKVGELRKPGALGHPGSLKKGKAPPVAVTSPITHTAQSALKVAGRPEGKAADKGKLAVKSAGLQRSSSDAGRDRLGDAKKPPSGIARPSTAGSFGYKKPPPATGTATVVQTGGSATLGKIQKSSGIPVKPANGRKTSLDVSNGAEPGFLAPGARSNIQYRSLPRPAKSSSMSVTGGRGGPRPVSSSIDPSLLSAKQAGLTPSRLKEPSKVASGRTTPAPVNQTDREKEKAKAKAVALDVDSVSVKSVGSPESTPKNPAGHSPAPKLAELPPTPLSNQRDRNTLPKKGLRYQLQSQEEAKERRHSHTIGGLPESDDRSELPSPSALSTSLSAKGQLTNIVSPTAATAPRITRSNSIPTHEAAFELYSGSQMGSTLSLADRPKGMIRSGSFRDPTDDVHGSVLSLASSASSTYSSAEERMQSEQIRKLRRELESSQEKVATLTSQLSANANLVAAFEQSLVNMTSRLRHLAETAEEKVLPVPTVTLLSFLSEDTELLDLRETIDFLKKKNSEAQAVIQGALSASEATPKELRIKRQNSSDSISSLNSITSHSSIGSGKDADAKKKKKKSWVYERSLTAFPESAFFQLRSSFNKAFSIKKGPKSASSYSDIEEIATPDSSAPSSPKLQHASTETASPSIKSSASGPAHPAPHARLFHTSEEGEPEKKEVSELRSELWEKEMKLTDIRLEALNSAHQLDQLRETMHNMQANLVAAFEQSLVKMTSRLTHLAETPRRRTPRLLDLRETIDFLKKKNSEAQAVIQGALMPRRPPKDLSPMDGVSTGGPREDVSLRVVVRMPPQHIIKGDLKQQEFFLGCSKVSGKVDWKMLDEAVFQVFQDYISKMDPASTLGLSTESIHGYSVSHVKRLLDTEPPELPPCRRGVNNIAVSLKGLKEKCVDSLVFETLIPKPMMQHYIGLLLKHRRLVLSGPSGTGKTYLTNRLAEYLVERSGREVTEGIVSTFNMHQQSCKVAAPLLPPLALASPLPRPPCRAPCRGLDLQLYLSNLANQLDRDTGVGDVPLVILLDDLSEAGSISELVNGALTCKYHKWMLTFSNNVEPANGFLVRYLRRKLLESDSDANANREELLRVLDWVPKLWYHLHTFLEKHSTSDFLIGPCFFLSCPIGIEDFRTWFIDLWNNSIIPYLQEGAKDGIKVHGQKAAWEDPVEWVRDTLPWPSAQQDQSKLYHLPPPTVGPHSTASPPEDRTVKDSTPSSLDSDPLMAMLLKLQEAANYIESPDRESILDPNLQATL
ncbi:Neuron navigator 1 [Camelus dromedarius]|uniref:Neuron navigator 1 n=1 Tax=Camelus dromedarius TaxID=9838 RepID=A0A5N4CI89_CAMDR|nr:Neuron navigator 1 [Camelus dromedarius]